MLLASNMIWSHLRSLQGVVSNGARLWILEFLNLQTIEIQTQFSDWKLSGFPLEWEGFNWGAKLACKVCLNWAPRACIYSNCDWYLHTSSFFQIWQSHAHACMGVYRPMKQSILVQMHLKWSLKTNELLNIDYGAQIPQEWPPSTALIDCWYLSHFDLTLTCILTVLDWFQVL